MFSARTGYSSWKSLSALSYSVKREGCRHLLPQHLGGGQEADAGRTHDGVEREHLGSNVNRDANEDDVTVRLLFQCGVCLRHASKFRIRRATQ